MFGTLKCNIQRQEPLTFVENEDPASALSRTQRVKPHTSCESCRRRKIKCNGEPSGCDKCVATSTECQYPGRVSRRRKHSRSRSRYSTRSNSLVVKGRQQSQDQEQAQEPNTAQGQSDGQGHEQEQGRSSPCVGSGQAGWLPTQTGDVSAGVFNLTRERDFGQQQMEPWQFSSSVDDGSCSESGKAEFDMDLDNYPMPMFAEQLGNLINPVDMTDDMMALEILGDSDNLSNFDVTDPEKTPSSFAGSEDMTYSTVLLPIDDVPPSIMATQPSPKQTSVPDSNTYNENINRFQRTPARLESQAASPMSDARWMISASSSDLLGQNKDGNRCRCLNLTARLLEDLGAKSINSDRVAIDVLLGYLRGALVNCTTILDCRRCTPLSDHNMLLAMAGVYMSTICERIVMCYLGLRRAGEREQPRVSTTAWDTAGSAKEETYDLNGGKGAGIGRDDMWFSTYRIESTCERMQVLRCLVMAQLIKFWRLLKRLRARAGSRRSHLVLLAKAEKKVMAIRSALSNQRSRPS